MTLEHVAIWTDNLEKLKEYYMKYFGGISNEKYTNDKTQFQSYFLSLNQGKARDNVYAQHPPNKK